MIKYENIKDYIHLEKEFIPKDLCVDIIQQIEKNQWSPHQWHSPISNNARSEETMELDVQTASPELNQVLTPYVIQAGAIYNSKFAYLDIPRMCQIMNKFCNIRFNRYSKGQIMREHFDHIHSIFDGNEKGIPVLSFILNFNDDYTGGELVFWGDQAVKLGCGDIIMFPSNFMYPHQVKEVTVGKRYSAVTWAW
jgi:predicted 2-oxoglutarate/Fe(II)-dependent dioxygenase YbiX